MFDLNVAVDLQRQHEDRVSRLAHDYRQGQADMEALAAFFNRSAQRVRNTVNGLRQTFGSMPRNPELHY